MATITEDYISYEVAKLLKEKGFNEPCECAYSAGGQYLLSCYKGIADRRIKNDEASDFSYSSTAPTHQMAIKWLREVHNIFIEISTSIDLNGKYHFSYTILDKECKYVRREYTDFNWNYEEAVEVALTYALENLI